MRVQEFFDNAIDYSMLGDLPYKISHEIDFKSDVLAIWTITMKIEWVKRPVKTLIFEIHIEREGDGWSWDLFNLYYSKGKEDEEEILDGYVNLHAPKMVVFSSRLNEATTERKTDAIFQFAKILNVLNKSLELQQMLSANFS